MNPDEVVFGSTDDPQVFVYVEKDLRAAEECVIEAAFKLISNRVDPNATSESVTDDDDALVDALFELMPERMAKLVESDDAEHL